MPQQPTEKIRKVTTEVSDELLRTRLNARDELIYRPVPFTDGNPRPTWRVRLEIAFNNHQTIGLDVNGEVILGRAEEDPSVIVVADTVASDHLGVSRQHAAIRPTEDKLYLVDLNSTNGTWLNNHSIGINTPYSLSDGDLITMGQLDVVVRIIACPRTNTNMSTINADLVAILPEIACRITSQLKREDVLKYALEMILRFTEASETSIWLVDEQTGELYLEAGRGADDLQVKRLPVTDSLPGHVIAIGKPYRTHRANGGQRVKIKTGYLVEAVIYVPLTLGGVTFGVMSAVHHESGKLFTQQEEKVMMAIAEFTAIGIQNARVYQTAITDLAHRSKVMTALNYALSYDVKNKANAIIGYTNMIVIDPALDEDTRDIARQAATGGDELVALIERLLEITTLVEEAPSRHKPCDLIDAIAHAMQAIEKKAERKSITLNFQILGNPYVIQGDYSRLYRSTINLLDNAIKYSPEGEQITIGLVYWDNEIALRVRDQGPGIPEEDLPHLFDRYYRSHPSSDGEISIGLGLEFVRATVEAHRGSIISRNADGGGAEFIIKLPSTLRVV